MQFNFAPMFEVEPIAVELTLDEAGNQPIELPQVIDGNVNDTFSVEYANLPKFVKNENN